MKLKEIRISHNLKVQEVANYLSCVPSVYGRYENGKREPSIDILLKLSQFYGVSVDYLIDNATADGICITEEEINMVKAMREADERARRDALTLLRNHNINK